VRDEGVVRFRSPDGEAQVLLSAPAGVGEAKAALKAELQAIAERYEVLEVGTPTKQKVGGLDGRQVVLTVADENGRDLRILIVTADGESHAYVIEVVTAADVAIETLREAQAIIDHLELKG
jgi:hypothetical protein